MGARKRRRRNIVMLVASVLSLALAAGIVAAVKYGLPSFSISRSSSALNSDRFKGLDGVVIPDHASEDLWWTSIDAEKIANLPVELGGSAPNSRFSRLIVPSDVLFDPESSELNEAAKQSVIEIASAITNPQAKVIVVCHSSADGRVERRQPLSNERADSLASALEAEMNREDGSIERIGLGASDPLPNIDPNTPTGRVLNRRCEVYVELLG